MRGPWRAALWVTAAAVLMAAIDLGRRILATNDEARFAMLAQDVLTRGAWLFPELNGVAYNNKPCPVPSSSAAIRRTSPRAATP